MESFQPLQQLGMGGSQVIALAGILLTFTSAALLSPHPLELMTS